jgi:hypothetical protein
MTISPNNSANQLQLNKTSKQENINQKNDIQSDESKNSNVKTFLNHFEEFGGVFENNNELKTHLKDYLNNTTFDVFGVILITMHNDFGGKLEQNSSGEVVVGKPTRNSEQEFATLESTKKYFQGEIAELLEAEQQYGGDTSKARELISNFINVIEKSQKDEQENSYLALGQDKNNNA